jgi:RND superfamily putative drug exporter
VRAVASAGRAVVISGLTVIIGFGALLLTPASETQSVGIGGLLVVAAAMLLAVTLLPAVLAVLGQRIDWPSWLSSRLTWYHTWEGWQRWSGWVARHRWIAATGGLLVLGAVTWPLTQIEVRMPPAGWFPAGTESSEGADALEAMGARGSLMPVRVIASAPEGERIVGTRYLRGLMRLSRALGDDQRVARVLGPVDLEPGVSALEYAMMYGDLATARERYPELMEAYVSEDGRTALTDLFLADTASATSGMEVVRDVRALVAEGVAGLEYVSVIVGGFAAAGVDEEDALKGAFPRMVALILLVTAVMLAIAFRSLLVPLKAVLMNLLSVAGAFGLMVLVFQWGYGASVFGLDAGTEAIHVVVPVLAFAIVFGLSMDYEVFLLSRIREGFDHTGDNDTATMEGLGATASFITSAAAIMVIVFGAFAFSRVQVAQMLGFALATAVLLDATIIRLVLVPAFMHIAGRWNWWPGVRGRVGRD